MGRSTHHSRIPAAADCGYSSKTVYDSGASTSYTFSASGTIQVAGSDVTGHSNTEKKAFLRFTDITVPQGSTISSATLYLKQNWASYNPSSKTITIKAVDADSASRPTAYADVWSATETTASGSYTLTPSYVSNNKIWITTIGPVIQEIVNRSSWASGNSIVL